MSRQSLAHVADRYVPFPDDPRLPRDVRRAAVNAWVKRQMALTFGLRGWTERHEWFLWLLTREARTRMAATGFGLAGWPCELDLHEIGRVPIQHRDIAS